VASETPARPATVTEPSIVGAVKGLLRVTRLLEALLFAGLAWLLIAAAGVPAWSLAVFAGATGGLVVLLGIRWALAARLRARAGGAPVALHPSGRWVTIWPSPQTVGWRHDLREPAVARGPLFAPLLTLLVWAGVQLSGAGGERISVDSGATLRSMALVGLLLVVHAAAATLGRQPGQGARRDRILAALGAGIALSALAAYYSGTTRIWGLTTPLHRGDPFGPFWYRNHFATFVLLVLPLALGESTRQMARLRRELVGARGRRLLVRLGGEAGAAALEWCFPPAVLLAALVATTSRAAPLALAMGLLVSMAACGTSRRRAGFVLASTLAFVGVAMAFAGPARLIERFARVQSDSSDRLAGWSAARELWRERPLAGWGLGAYPAAVEAHPDLQARLAAVHRHLLLAPHNEYLRLGAELGAPAIVLGAWAASAALRRARHDAWAFASLASLMLHAVVDFPFGVPVLGVLAALIAAPARGPDARPAKVMDR
jgi:hypothetical protein